MEAISTIAMIAGLLIQNYAEWRGGGPQLPPRLPGSRFLPAITAPVRRAALIIVSVVVVAACAVAWLADLRWIVVAIAAALIANALAQLGASLAMRQRQPGTIAGLAFMLPTSLWAIQATGWRYGWLPVVAGPILTAPLLAAVWALAFRISGGRER